MPVEVKVPVPVYCEVDIPETDGPDLAPSDSDVYEASLYALGRIISLRNEVEGLRGSLDACKEKQPPPE